MNPAAKVRVLFSSPSSVFAHWRFRTTVQRPRAAVLGLECSDVGELPLVFHANNRKPKPLDRLDERIPVGELRRRLNDMESTVELQGSVRLAEGSRRSSLP